MTSPGHIWGPAADTSYRQSAVVQGCQPAERFEIMRFMGAAWLRLPLTS